MTKKRLKQPRRVAKTIRRGSIMFELNKFIPELLSSEKILRLVEIQFLFSNQSSSL